MVRGLDKFKDHFRGMEDRYVLIGGTASTLAMEELGLPFRATQDLDIVLCLEALDKAFAERFWQFVRDGAYEDRHKSTGKRLFYRFVRPSDPTYPKMLELFSKVPDALDLEGAGHLTPIPIDEAVSSLSAILLDEQYYGFIREHKRMVDGLSIAGAECLIPLKARAFTDLHNEKETGKAIDSRDIKKHRNDIYRLAGILDPQLELRIPDAIKADLEVALDRMRKDPIDLNSIGIKGRTPEAVIDQINRIYRLCG